MNSMTRNPMTNDSSTLQNASSMQSMQPMQSTQTMPPMQPMNSMQPMQSQEMLGNSARNMMGQSPDHRYGAHEFLAMNESLMTKAANVESMAAFALQAEDPRLADILQRQAGATHQHYMKGVTLLHGAASSHGLQMNRAYPIPGGQPQIGLHQPSMPAPMTNTQALSDRTISMLVLNMHKYGATCGMAFALECANVELRTYLVEGALNCDRMAYEIWMYANERGYYQVPQLADHTMQTMMQAYQMAPHDMGFNPHMTQMVPSLPNAGLPS